ncbi:hypothetical protein EVAR_24096_1 [Eumeta japonica]|uniref:DUF4371 domain-containing protein n=1 Tax=Eumeta variegata TaxID=151549 RepID=A0A4C1ZVL1_EUMVA|nr:hypothetical protein EVAR_24096_1 [Eumeta japonica]
MASTDSNSDSVGPSTPKKQKKREIKKSKYKQKFGSEWLTNKDFSTWLSDHPTDSYKAICTLCSVTMNAEISVLKRHKDGAKHIEKNKGVNQQPSIKNILEKSKFQSADTKVKRAELKLAAFMTEHKIPHSVMDHLSDLMADILPDSAIATNLKMKHSKLQAVKANVLGVAEKESLVSDLKCHKFSVLVDESTDIGIVETMCVVVHYYDPTIGRVVGQVQDKNGKKPFTMLSKFMLETLCLPHSNADCERVFMISREGDGDTDVMSQVVREVFEIKQHQDTKQHKAKTELKRTSGVLQKFLTPASTSRPVSENDNVTAAELASSFHTVKHNLSYNSMDCSVKLDKIIYVDSKTATNIKLARTKMEALVMEVLGPCTLECVVNDLKDENMYFCLQTDASNKKKNIKLFPLVVQYFTVEKGIQNKLLDFYENANESADGMFAAIKNLCICIISLLIEYLTLVQITQIQIEPPIGRRE